jgi:cytosine/adenosine deaminase-related metal-dependent hydrolase
MKTVAMMLALSAALPAASPIAPGASGSVSPTRYTVLLMGNKAGLETSSREADGSLHLAWEFNDRGRGPKVDERLVLDPAGLPVRLRNSGNDYLKAKVDEQFSIENGRAAWKNGAEAGSREISGKAFYLSLSGVPEEIGILARATLAAGGRLPLLPAGEASLEKRGELKIEAGGRSRTVMQYAVTGLDFAPTPVWLDPDGKFFAIVYGSWQAVVPEGWESAVESMEKAQNRFEEERAARLAGALAHRPGKPLAIVHANLFDSVSATTHRGSTVVIEGQRIRSVGEDGKVDVPAGAEVIDAAGGALLPGLWDMHVHLQPNDGLLDMASGVTSVRDLANDTDRLLQMRGRFDRGEEIGPRVLMAGLLDGRGPYAAPTKVFADSESEAKEAIDRYAKLGYVQIKIYSSIKPELVPKIVETARSHGLRVSGHVPAFMSAEEFVRDGADEIQHMNFIFLNFMRDVKDTRTPARFTEVAARAAEIGIDSDPVKSFIQLLRERGTVMDPTLGVFEGMFVDRPGTMAPGFAAIADRMPAQVRRGFLTGGLPVPEGKDQRYRDSFRQMQRMTKAFYDAGIPIVAGTDSLAGFSLHRELELYEEAGIPAPRVLQLATLGAARVMKRDDELGSIAPGKLADLFLVDGDPSSRISDIRRIRTVMKDGIVYRSSDLCRALGVAPP